MDDCTDGSLCWWIVPMDFADGLCQWTVVNGQLYRWMVVLMDCADGFCRWIVPMDHANGLCRVAASCRCLWVRRWQWTQAGRRHWQAQTVENRVFYVTAAICQNCPCLTSQYPDTAAHAWLSFITQSFPISLWKNISSANSRFSEAPEALCAASFLSCKTRYVEIKKLLNYRGTNCSSPLLQ